MNTIPTPAARFRCLRLAPLLLFAAVLRAELPATYAAGDLEGLEEKLDDADVSALLGEKPKRDFDLLQTTHLSMLAAWDQAKEGGMSTLIAVPEDGAYRVSLRHVVGFEAPFPVTLTLTPQTTDAGPGLTHVFGQLVLAGGKTGKQQEQTLPIRFETETQLIAVPSDNTMVWEYWDTDLPKGVYRATLTKADPQVRAHALLLTRSKDFRPSLSSFPKDRTLGRVYMRFKATETNSKSGGTFAVNAGLGYHWRGRRPPGAPGDCWGWAIGTTPATPLGAWSPFVEATDAIVPGPGPWSTCNLSVNGVRNGKVEVQFAWFPHAQAVVKSVETEIGDGQAMLRVPNGAWTLSPRTGVPAWGMWSAARLNEIMTQEAVMERYFTWAEQAAQRLGLKEHAPRPNLIRLFTGCGVLPPYRERAAKMLAKLGLNWIDGAPASVVKQYGLHDETCAYNTTDAAGLARGMSEADRRKLTKVKIGDEIGTCTPPEEINTNATKHAAFHAYLQEQAHLEGLDLPAFLGVKNVDDPACIAERPAHADLFERRLFYHSQCFRHLVTCDGYAAAVRDFERLFPNVHVYNNYSPHPVFLTGSTMNECDWFVLPRHKAQTLGWAEDWAYYNGWDLGTQYQCTSFYAALVDCSVRKYGYPAGFYVGSNCGGSAQKIFSCVAQGVTWLHLYDWGPIDRWAEGSNAWSENENEYYAVMRAAYAIGAADTIIGEGRREPRRTALLYNRSHEIMQGGTGRLNYDWMWTFIGLKSSQIPVDVIIEEDLNPTDLKRYDCVILGGFNLAKRHLAELRRWVEAGGLLIGTGGAALYDVYNDPMPETVDVFGARQRLSGPEDTGSVSHVTFQATDWFPGVDLHPGGMTFRLEPTTGRSLAAYDGGGCAAVVNAIGKGQAILLGFHPGLTFRDNGRATGQARTWLAAPVLKRLGRQRLEFDYPSSEATLFEHASGLAVMLADFGGASPKDGSRLSVQTDRPIRSVVSAWHGPLEWKRAGDRIEIKTCRLDPVDVVILKDSL